MKNANTLLIGAMLSLVTLMPLSAVAQAAGDAGKITIKHDIKHLEMPGMTMVFAAKDKALLDKAQVGDKIRFMVINEGGKMVVTAIEPAK